MQDREELRHLLALGLIPGIGDILTRFLVSYVVRLPMSSN
jgi:hypothetical protein